MEETRFTDRPKKEAIEFGCWLLAQNVLPTEEHQVWETSEGEWLFVEELYDKWLNGKTGQCE